MLGRVRVAGGDAEREAPVLAEALDDRAVLGGDARRAVGRAVVHNEHVSLREPAGQLIEDSWQVLFLVPRRDEDERVSAVCHRSSEPSADRRPVHNRRQDSQRTKGR